ncbi:hypothetical protein [Streptomyces sp. NPDC050759]|uniref:hypothetical protein n=1 Tax=Streptomyces sp. NPDC050759 TaxID=3365635 RepID=UPI0037A07024
MRVGNDLGSPATSAISPSSAKAARAVVTIAAPRSAGARRRFAGGSTTLAVLLPVGDGPSIPKAHIQIQ